MREIPLLKKEHIRRTGKFDFRGMYVQLYYGMGRDGWDIKEKRYVEKSKPGAEKKNIEVHWVGYLTLDNYTRARFDLLFELTDVAEPMTQWEPGVTRPIFDGVIDVYFYYTLELDYTGKWVKDPILKHFQHFYEGRIYKRTLDTIKEEHWKHGWDYLKVIKELLGQVAVHEVGPIHEIPLKEE